MKEFLNEKFGKWIDNGTIETFFGTLKVKQYYINKYYLIELLRQAMEEYIEFYNTKRMQAKLKGLTPMDYRNQALIVYLFLLLSI
ncbi:MAG: IS3 family transposase [Bacilli bacterium]|nr:IS3 family transposase [Bacilli bacterium]